MFKKSMFFILFLFITITFSQTAIPLPSSFPNASSMICTVIGDFDGDGSMDLHISCTDYKATGTYIMGVYSVKKQQYLLVESKPSGEGAQYINPIFSDFNGDGKNEIIVNNILYSFSTTMSKKKVF